ncbi:FAD/NAD(P)-binding protein [Streptomyces sp. NPDC096153]|uniref:FAD/NAD(P)-binding protein n=1 Tax=Streptomyces sp. NPDC096153 TaxID=3155548 RepID=UPI003328160F
MLVGPDGRGHRCTRGAGARSRGGRPWSREQNGRCPRHSGGEPPPRPPAGERCTAWPVCARSRFGGGGGAVCLLDALSQESGPPAAVTVFEPSDRLWRGRPYQRDADCILVNLPSRAMSVRAGDTRHFDRWLADRRRQTGALREVSPFDVAAFPPRAVFGDYLESVAQQSVARLDERGGKVRLVRERSVRAAPAAGGAVLTTERGTRHEADRVVLCIGAGVPDDGFGLDGPEPGFVPDPYPVARTLAGIDPQHTVAVLGTGLTAVDVALALRAGGHQGPVFLLSRHGVLPAVRQQPVVHTLRHFTCFSQEAPAFRPVRNGSWERSREAAELPSCLS